VTVQAAGTDDAETVCRSMRRAFEEYRDRLQPPSSALDETVDDVRAAIARGGAFLARDGGVVVGSARYQVRVDHVYAERVAVDPGHRGRGIGAALVHAIEEVARAAGHAEIRIGVRASLPGTLRFWEGLGYRVRASRRHPRGPDFDMTLTKAL
jgi:GNAT superfamily N-acetyltransferase